MAASQWRLLALSSSEPSKGAAWTHVLPGSSGNTGEVSLVLVGSQLAVLHGNVAMETTELALGPATHRAFKQGKVFILASNRKRKTRRLRFKFASEADCEAFCCQLLGLVPVKSVRDMQSAAAVDDEAAVQDYSASIKSEQPPPAPHPPPTLPFQHWSEAELDEFIRLAVLDRGFVESFVKTGECWLALGHMQLMDKTQDQRHANIG